jgi:hypothetical protein
MLGRWIFSGPSIWSPFDGPPESLARLRHDRIERVAQLWQAMGGSEEQAIAASVTLADKGFDWTGSVLNFNGKAATAEAVREHFAQSAIRLPPTD